MRVTHLPQVQPGAGHQHFFVSKETDGAMTETHMQPLINVRVYRNWPACWEEVKLRCNTLANAKELLAA